MVGLEVEVVRATLVIGIIIGALVYHFTRVSSGGVVTTPLLTMLVMTGRWADILGWALIALAGVGIIRLLALRWPLPPPWRPAHARPRSCCWSSRAKEPTPPRRFWGR